MLPSRAPLFAIILSLPTLAALTATSTRAQTAAPVTLSEDEASYTLSNGIVTAKVSKRSGNLTSLVYHNLETVGRGYWSHSPGGAHVTSAVTIDPKTNGGERAEVSITGVSGGERMGSGPGGSTIADIEVRYCLGRGESGIYTYSIFTHKSGYPATSVGEARFCVKLDEIFDWMTVDANRNMKMITAADWDHGTVMNMKEARRMTSGIYEGQVEHKYDYSANQFETLAWGWSSTEKHIGFWFVNPTIEYLSGGPTKVELSAHRDATFGTDLTAPAPPTLLNYWRGSHYGGSRCEIAAGEEWTKVIGPFLIYCNSGDDPQAMWKDALAQSPKETAAWPYDWVQGVDYPHKNQRGTVSGKLVLKDPLATAPMNTWTHLLVGLAYPDTAGGGGSAQRGGGGGSDWQNDAKHYEFWVRGNSDGSFTIPNVRPGTYELHAITDGVLGQLNKSNVTVTGGETLDLDALEWQPVRYGRQLWDVGIPNRTGSEFFKGDDYFHWGWYLEYAKLFPDDVNYVVGKSDYHKDWFFEQVPHNENPSNNTGGGNGRSTTWSVAFDLPEAPHGKATLRMAICGVGARSIDVAVNGKPAGSVTGLAYNATINRDGIGGYWVEKDVVFDAVLMHSGSNTVKLTIPAGGLTSGILYDYIRLELDEAAAPPSKNSTPETPSARENQEQNTGTNTDD